MHDKADEIIALLNLKVHPEGGYFSEIYRCSEIIDKAALDARYSGSRAMSTSIYFLLKSGQVSKFHSLKSDEIWHFYTGSALKLYEIDSTGNITETIIGNDILNGEKPQTIIKAGNWFGAEVIENNSFSLIGCTVAPGFDFQDFELADFSFLLEHFPQHEKIIRKLLF